MFLQCEISTSGDVIMKLYYEKFPNTKEKLTNKAPRMDGENHGPSWERSLLGLLQALTNM
jgi:hypothetical protein